PSFLDKFRVVVMSDDSEVGGARKPHARIFNVAISKMKKVLNTSLNLSETALLTETIEHFKAYNLLYSLDGRKIIREWFKEYFEL
ncbi:MAG TPA: hypothetical protein VKA95_06175, partial [Nitrososphaeraceae archaeon]|nr:hypothetical protein [Nitrososphaeraceae archaeon]